MYSKVVLRRWCAAATVGQLSSDSIRMLVAIVLDATAQRFPVLWQTLICMDTPAAPNNRGSHSPCIAQCQYAVLSGLFISVCAGVPTRTLLWWSARQPLSIHRTSRAGQCWRTGSPSSACCCVLAATCPSLTWSKVCYQGSLFLDRGDKPA